MRQEHLASHRIAKTNKPFTIGEELITDSCVYTDIWGEVLGESASKKIAQVPLSARTDELRIWQ